MKSRILACTVLAVLLSCSAALAGPIEQNILRNLGWWYGPGYHAYNGCPCYPKRPWTFCPTTFPAPVPYGVAIPQRSSVLSATIPGYGFGQGCINCMPEIHHYPATPYSQEPTPVEGVEIIEEPMAEPGSDAPEME
ncbi:MAG: hypothetical protein K1X74_11140 [Pirellulales bacterium]|nr:hypothetical protein [Pirellulales bacterium]